MQDSTWKVSEKEGQYLVLTGKEYAERLEAGSSSQKGKKMYNWKLPSISGDTLTNSAFEKKLTLYEFFL